MRGMGLTLSHTSALRALRRIRANDVDINTLETTSFTDAKPLVGKRWSEREFLHESWHWQVPRTKDPLHVLSTSRDERILYTAIRRHLVLRTLPLGSLLYLDERASIVCPELLFIQMAEMLTLPQLVALGNELCGNFCCDEMDPCNGEATLKIPHATTVEKLVIYLNSIKGIRGLVRAREALRYVCDNALSIPEAVLAAVYSLPPRESGYGMASLTLNDRYVVDEDAWTEERKTRVPDIMLPFAPIGINYDGEGHLDLDAIVRANETVHMVDPKDVEQARAELDACCRRVRSKYVDDIRRNRELLAAGKVVLPLTKEDLYEKGRLDAFTKQLLRVSHALFGVEVADFMAMLDDTALARDRWDVLSSLLMNGWGVGQSSRTK